jgi:hypothetical protein
VLLAILLLRRVWPWWRFRTYNNNSGADPTIINGPACTDIQGPLPKSHTSRHTINQTLMSSVSVTQINVDVNNLQPAYSALGMGSVPAGTTIANGVAAIEKVLIANLASGWPAAFAPYLSYQMADGIMEPWTANVPGSAPACVTQQLINSFNGWQLPYSTTAINQIAIEITQQIGSNGGQAGTFYGQTTLAGGGETLYWGVAYTTAVVVGPPDNSVGIIYAFSGSLGL